MSTNPRLVTTGYIDSGETAIQTDATYIPPIGVTVQLLTAYTRPDPWPPGWPIALSIVGSEQERLDVPGATWPSGSVLMFVAPESAALIAAGAAELA